MLLHIVARGRIGRGPEAELVARYVKRLSWPYKVTELPDSGGKIPALDPGTRVVLLDETGVVLPSCELQGRSRNGAIRACARSVS